GGLGVPDRRARLQLLDIGEYALGVGFVQIDAIARGQIIRVEIAVARASLRRHPGEIAEHVGPGVTGRRQAGDLDRALAGLAVPDEGVAPARRRPRAEVDVVGTFLGPRDQAPRGLRR